MKIEKLSKKQFKIFSFAVSPVPFLICDGAVRSGKTVCMGAAFLMWAMDQFDRTNFAICGKTVANAERNVLAPLLNVENLPYLMRYNRAERKLICRCGSRENYFYLFGGKDESSYTLIQGITLAGVLLDEVALMPRSFVDQAMARTLTYQNAKVWFNCNPEGQLHWFNQEWIIPTDRGQRKATHLHFLMSDNPILGPEELSKVESMFSGVFYDRYIRGLWVAAEGLIYDMFSRERHILDALPATEGVYYVSCDYGTQNPTVFLLWRKERGLTAGFASRSITTPGGKNVVRKQMVSLQMTCLHGWERKSQERLLLTLLPPASLPSFANVDIQFRKRTMMF